MINVGVLFRNNEKLVEPFFFFLRLSEPEFQYRVIAVDQGSEDKTAEKLLQQKQLQDIVILSPENIGVAAGRNRIVSECCLNSGKHGDIVFMDSDCFIMYESSVEAMAQQDADIVYGTVDGFRESNREHGKTSGFCFCLVRGYVFDAGLSFDERFMMYYDDVDFVQRAMVVGFDTSVCSEAKVLHLWGATITHGSEKGRWADVLERDKDTWTHKLKTAA